LCVCECFLCNFVLFVFAMGRVAWNKPVMMMIILIVSDWRRGRYWKLSPRLSGTVMKIWRLKDNGVTTLIFWVHVTSSVTWPFDSRWSTSYGWYIVTMRLSLSSRYNHLKFFQKGFSRNGDRWVGRSSILHWSHSCSLREERSARGLTSNLSKAHDARDSLAVPVLRLSCSISSHKLQITPKPPILGV